MKYYLINNKIMKGSEMPETHNLMRLNDEFRKVEDKIYSDWLSSLQPCEISESELDKINRQVRINIISNNLQRTFSNPIDITDIVEEKQICGYERCVNESESCVKCQYPKLTIVFKHPKQFDGEIEAVYGYIAIKDDVIISGIYNHLHRIQEDYPKSEIYEIFKNRK